MASLKKNFSIAQLYSDLEKYEANLTGFKDSRLKKQASGVSLHQRPSSTNHKEMPSRQSFAYSNLSRFQKTKPQFQLKSRHPRPTYDKNDRNEQISYSYLVNSHKGTTNNQNSLILRQNTTQNKYDKQNKRRSPSNVQFNKNDELYFLRQCNKLYNLNSKDANLTQQEEADSLNVLLRQINKRDQVYDCVTKKLGTQNIEAKLNEFFANYERMAKIVTEFKRMSKLNIDNDQQLYQFLINDDEQNKQEGLNSQKWKGYGDYPHQQ